MWSSVVLAGGVVDAPDAVHRSRKFGVLSRSRSVDGDAIDAIDMERWSLRRGRRRGGSRVLCTDTRRITDPCWRMGFRAGEAQHSRSSHSSVSASSAISMYIL